MLGRNGDNETTDAIHGDNAMGWELFGRAAVRKGNWKLVHVPELWGGRGDGNWQLYNLAQDPGETQDLSGENPDVVTELLKMWDQYRAETGTVWGMPIRFVGEEWAGIDDEDMIGGDPVEQTRAWMRVRKNESPGLAS